MSSLPEIILTSSPDGPITAYNLFPAPSWLAFTAAGPLTATLDGSYLFAGGVSGQIHAVSIASGEVVGSFPAHEKPVSCLEVNYDGSLLISGSDGTITVSPVFLLVDAYSDPKWGRSVLHRFLGHDSTVTGITAGSRRGGAIMISCS